MESELNGEQAITLADEYMPADISLGLGDRKNRFTRSTGFISASKTDTCGTWLKQKTDDLNR